MPDPIPTPPPFTLHAALALTRGVGATPCAHCASVGAILDAAGELAPCPCCLGDGDLRWASVSRRLPEILGLLIGHALDTQTAATAKRTAAREAEEEAEGEPSPHPTARAYLSDLAAALAERARLDLAAALAERARLDPDAPDAIVGDETAPDAHAPHVKARKKHK